MFLLLPYFAIGGYAYIRDTGNLFLLRNYGTRVVIVALFVIVLNAIAMVYTRVYLSRLAQEYEADTERIASRWYFRLYVAILTVEYIGMMVFSCIENHR